MNKKELKALKEKVKKQNEKDELLALEVLKKAEELEKEKK